MLLRRMIKGAHQKNMIFFCRMNICKDMSQIGQNMTNVFTNGFPVIRNPLIIRNCRFEGLVKVYNHNHTSFFINII